ncbi:MAG: UDP-galactose-4-epimerase [candidate division BRC1 bacterium ADurb.BinA364]|nr:MAG: UDP-galactose-4-epimerase [candidate division BRC1 bacterium ADurb.BinA364]
MIHNAAIPHNIPDRQLEIFRVNLQGTANVLEAMARHGTRRLIYTSSLCVYGIANSGRLPLPAWFPLDESFPARPDNAYGLSKLLAEGMIEGYRERYGWDAIVFRLAWVRDIAAAASDSQALERVFEQLREPRWEPYFVQHFWDYIDVSDAGRAFAMAAAAPGVSGVFNLAASDMWTLENPRALLQRHYPGAEIRNPAIWEGGSCWDVSAIRRAIGFEPKVSVRELLRDKQVAFRQ